MIERVLAQNLRGRVYVAVSDDDRRVVLKELVFRTVPGPGQIEAFAREGRLLHGLKHPQIPRFLGTCEEGEGVHTRLYLAQEWVEGETLLAALGRRRVDEREATDLATQCLSVLTYLHGPEVRLLHRDIKPANLIIDPRGTLWLVDFGTARMVADGDTHRSTLVGTFGYMPPEQLGGTSDVTSDLYALGATLIHLLGGRPPDELLDDDLRIVFEPFLHVTESFKQFLGALVARDRGRRPKSAAAALRLLRARPARSRLAVAAASVVVIAVAVAIAVSSRSWLGSTAPAFWTPPGETGGGASGELWPGFAILPHAPVAIAIDSTTTYRGQMTSLFIGGAVARTDGTGCGLLKNPSLVRMYQTDRLGRPFEARPEGLDVTGLRLDLLSRTDQPGCDPGHGLAFALVAPDGKLIPGVVAAGPTRAWVSFETPARLTYDIRLFRGNSEATLHLDFATSAASLSVP